MDCHNCGHIFVNKMIHLLHFRAVPNTRFLTVRLSVANIICVFLPVFHYGCMPNAFFQFHSSLFMMTECTIYMQDAECMKAFVRQNKRKHAYKRIFSLIYFIKSHFHFRVLVFQFMSSFPFLHILNDDISLVFFSVVH